MTKYLSCLCLLFFVSCASEKKKPEVKNYSADTNRAFEMIERGGSYYLKKAPPQAPPPQIEAPKKVYRPVAPAAPVMPEEKIEKEITAPAPEAPKATHINAKVDERLIEINQNLAFYCMKHRKDPAYGGDEEKCLKFVAKIQKKCQAQHRIVNSKLLNCIRTGLKKR